MPLKILVVDDSATDRQVLQHVLSDYEVLAATNGIDATLLLVERHSGLDLIILDLNMPGMDGFQFLEFLGEKHLLERIRTIIFTNHEEPDNEVKELQLGAVDFVRKPVDAEVLKARAWYTGSTFANSVSWHGTCTRRKSPMTRFTTRFPWASPSSITTMCWNGTATSIS